MRRLPVYLLVDTSESTVGTGHDSVEKGIQQLIRALRKDPYALETAWISIISFDRTARVVVPLTELTEFTAVPKLDLQPGTSLGAALELLRDRIASEVVRTTMAKKGDWRPLVFILTDGEPTDEWAEAFRNLRACKPKPANIYAIGCGDDVNLEMLQEISDFAFKLHGQTDDELGANLKKLFVWLSASIASASRGADDNASPLEKTPEGIDLIDDDYRPDWKTTYPRNLFLHAMCPTAKKKSLVRFTFDGAKYGEVKTFPLEDNFRFHGGGAAPAIPTELIDALPICPHCGGFQGLSCPRCGCILCVKEPIPEQLECPNCHNVAGLDLSSDGPSLDSIRGSAG